MQGRRDDEYWLARARQVATDATSTMDPSLKATLLRLVETYEYLASRAAADRLKPDC